MDHLGEADEYLYRAEEHRNLFSDSDNLAAAGTHAVLALIDIITGDRETEIEQLHNRIAELEEQRWQKVNVITEQAYRIDELEKQLDGCNDTLRRHEQAATNAAKTNNDLRKSYE